MKKVSFFTIMLCLSLSACFAQENPKGLPEITQPRIMVFPWVKKDEDRKAAFDINSNIRIAIAKINEAFQKREANLVDFDAFLTELEENKTINKSAGNQKDFNSMVLSSAAADIYVGTEILVVDHPERGAKSVTVIMNAYQAGTAKSLSSKTAAGPMFKTQDIGVLTMKAIDTVTVDFLNTMQLAFNKVRSNGQSVYLEFSLDANSTLTFDSEIGADAKFLSQIIKGWVKNNSVKGVYNFQGTTGKKMIFSDVKLPLIDPTEGDESYTGDNIYRDIYKYLKAQGVKVKREISNNNKIVITIL
jgi:hypothetical protein